MKCNLNRRNFLYFRYLCVFKFDETSTKIAYNNIFLCSKIRVFVWNLDETLFMTQRNCTILKTIFYLFFLILILFCYVSWCVSYLDESLFALGLEDKTVREMIRAKSASFITSSIGIACLLHDRELCKYFYKF